VRVLPDGEGSRIEVAGLDRTTAGEGLDDEVRRILGTVRGAGPETEQERWSE